jgi:hypothetical protein
MPLIRQMLPLADAITPLRRADTPLIFSPILPTLRYYAEAAIFSLHY